MHRRPRLQEALSVLQSLSTVAPEAQEALEMYDTLKLTSEFNAAHFVVEIVDLHYHLTGVTDAQKSSFT